MLIANFNMIPSRISWENEIQSIFPNTLLAEKLVLAASIVYEFSPYNNFDDLNDDTVLKQLLHHYKEHPDYIKVIERHIEQENRLKKVVNKKRKDKITLHIIALGKKMMRNFRSTLKEYYVYRLTTYKILELAGFAKEEIWETYPSLSLTGKNQEDGHIPILTEIITSHEIMLSFNSVVEDLFSYAALDSGQKDNFDFIKIPLWDFPTFDGITFEQMKYTIEDLKPALVNYNVKLADLTEKLFKIPFTSTKQSKIRKLCTDNLIPLIPIVQQSINDSLYLSQLKHKSKENSGMTFNMGVTSAENLVNYYEKAEIILPYISTETKEQLKRVIDLKASCLFFYVTVKTPDSV